MYHKNEVPQMLNGSIKLTLIPMLERSYSICSPCIHIQVHNLQLSNTCRSLLIQYSLGPCLFVLGPGEIE
jgi:hypothetical protein